MSAPRATSSSFRGGPGRKREARALLAKGATVDAIAELLRRREHAAYYHALQIVQDRERDAAIERLRAILGETGS